MRWLWRLGEITIRPWRSVPELDEFPDDECRALLGRVRWVRWLAGVLAVLVALVLGVAAALGSAALADAVFGPWWNYDGPAQRAVVLALISTILVSVAAAAMSVYASCCVRRSAGGSGGSSARGAATACWGCR